MVCNLWVLTEVSLQAVTKLHYLLKSWYINASFNSVLFFCALLGDTPGVEQAKHQEDGKSDEQEA